MDDVIQALRGGRTHDPQHPLRGRHVWISPDFDEPDDDLWESLYNDDFDSLRGDALASDRN